MSQRNDCRSHNTKALDRAWITAIRLNLVRDSLQQRSSPDCDVLNSPMRRDSKLEPSRWFRGRTCRPATAECVVKVLGLPAWPGTVLGSGLEWRAQVVVRSDNR